MEPVDTSVLDFDSDFPWQSGFVFQETEVASDTSDLDTEVGESRIVNTSSQDGNRSLTDTGAYGHYVKQSLRGCLESFRRPESMAEVWRHIIQMFQAAETTELQTPAPDLHRVRDEFVWRDPDSVRAFLEEHFDLIPLVESVGHKLEAYFPGTDFCLEVIDDPDDTDEKTYLACFVITELAPDDAEERYERFRDDWWLNAKSGTKSRLVICLEYIDDVRLD